MNGLIFQIRSRDYGKEVEIFTEIPISADAKKKLTTRSRIGFLVILKEWFQIIT